MSAPGRAPDSRKAGRPNGCLTPSSAIENWQDYEVSADIYLDDGGWAGVMGRVNNVGNGYGCVPKGYYLRLAADGNCALVAINGKAGDAGTGR